MMLRYLTIVLLVIGVPEVLWAHGGGDEDNTSIDEHHEELRATLQEKMGDAYDDPVVGLGSADVDNGSALYTQQCASCHGETGVGDGRAGASLDPTPSDLTNGDQMTFISDAGFMEVIGAGLENTGMPAYDGVLTEQEQLDVYAYTKTLRVTSSKKDDHACSVHAVHHAHSDSTHGWLVVLGVILGVGAMLRRP